MIVIGIDPGPEQSAYVRWDGYWVAAHGIEPNEAIRVMLRSTCAEVVVIEQVESYGMAVGRDVFETVHEAGRMFESISGERRRLVRRAVKLHLCGSSRAKDSNIRQALIDRFGGTGGRRAAIGVKADPGPLYGIRSHEWAALAVAVTWHDQHGGHNEGNRSRGDSCGGPVAGGCIP